MIKVDEEFFRDRLRFFRNQKKISAREMSLELGQNETFINKIETGRSSTTISSFLNICEYLRLSPADFFNTEIKSSAENAREMTRLFRRLSPRQSKYILELLRDLTAENLPPSQTMARVKMKKPTRNPHK